MSDKRKKPAAGMPLSPKTQAYRDRAAFEQKRTEVVRKGWEARRKNNPPNGCRP